MSTTRRNWLAAALATAAALTLISGPAVAKKPVKPPSDDGGTPPGTIFFGMAGDLFGMSGDGGNKYVASPVTSPPSHFTYGADNHRWILGALDFTEVHPDGDPRRELAMLLPDPSLPDGGEWIQVTDLYEITETDPDNAVEMFCGQVGPFGGGVPKNPYALWARDDSFVSFLGVDWRNLTQGIFRVPITALEVDVLRQDTPVRGLDDLETVVSLPLLETSRYLMGFAWSPQGDKVAFPVCDDSSQAQNRWELYVRTIDGSQPDLLIWAGDGYYSYGGLDWSPDGTKIACEIGQSIVTVDPAVEDQQPTVVVERWGRYRAPVWSPDSQYIAVTVVEHRANMMSLPARYYIGRVSASGGPVKKLTRDLDSWTMKEVYRWTP